MQLTDEQKYLRKRIIEISYAAHLSHIGSCLSVIDIVAAIYRSKKQSERFVLSNGHAGVALYVILEKYNIIDSAVIKNLHVHPDRKPALGIDVSSGSLGQGVPIALGMALADRKKDVYCVISDGECAEGSVWETLRLGIELKMNNMKIVVNANGWGAYDPISLPALYKRIRGFGYEVTTVDGHDVEALFKALTPRGGDQPLIIFAKTDVEQFPFLKGQDAHYYVMTQEDYQSAMDALR